MEDFGKAFLTHRIGRGRLYDYAEANESSFIEKSSLHDTSQVFDSIIAENSIIRGNSIISNAEIVNSIIEDSVISGQHRLKIENSVIRNGVVVSGNAIIKDSVIADGARIFDDAKIQYANISQASIYGNAEIIGTAQQKTVIDGFLRVPTGLWARSPRYFRYDFGVSLTESTDGYALVGCLRKKINVWVKNRYKFAEFHGWTKKDADHAAEILTEWSKDYFI